MSHTYIRKVHTCMCTEQVLVPRLLPMQKNRERAKPHTKPCTLRHGPCDQIFQVFLMLCWGGAWPVRGYIHVYWTCATMVAVITLTGWVLCLPNQIHYDDNDQDDENCTNKSTYHSSCNSPCIRTTTNWRGTCCWCCWRLCLRWWLSWCFRWQLGWCWRCCSCREWH